MTIKTGRLRVCAMGNKTRRIAVLMCLLLLFPGFAPVGGAEQSSNRLVKAGIFYFDGYHMKDGDGYTGYGIELLNLISQYSHLNFSFRGYDQTWEDMLSMLDSGEIDVVTSARKTAQREELYAFSLPVGRDSTVLSTRANNAELISGDYSTYQGITVGVLAGSGQEQRLAEFAKANGFTYRTVEYADTNQAKNRMETDLRLGVLDAILSNSLRTSGNEKTLDTIETDYFYAMVRKEDTELLAEINYAIDQMNRNEGDWSNILYYKYYGNGSSSVLFFTARERAYIQDVVAGKKRITATSMGDRRPYSYVEDGELKGILPEYFAQLMELAGLPYETVVPRDRSEYYELANNDGVDVVMDWRQDQLKASGRSNTGFYTDTYMNIGIALVTRKDFDGTISTLAVADLQGDIAIEQDMIGDAQILNCQTRENALQAVLDGRADATYVYTYTAQSFVNNDPTASLQYSMVNSMRFDVKMYLRNSCDHELITILNKSIRRMPDDSISDLITKYTKNTPENMSVGQYMRANPEAFVMSALIAAIAVGIMLFFYLRSRWSQQLLNTTERANRELEEQLAIVNTLSRDYINVYAVNSRTGVVRPVKITDYESAGLEPDFQGEIRYNDILTDYIYRRVFPEDRQYLSEALALDNVIEKLNAVTEFSAGYRVLDDGVVHTYQFTCAARLTADGNGWGGFFLVGFRIIDEIVRREREQREMLEGALAEAQRANVAKTTFLNNMSHDIRTPMNAIIGFTSLAVTHIDDQERVKGYLEKILTSGRHLLNLINDILDMSRIESGKVRIEENEVSLPEILLDLKTIVHSDVKAKQLSLRMDVPDLANETVLCDKLRLNQVLLNILSNAVKYTKPGGTIMFRVDQTGLSPDGYASYQFQVKDTGIGMSKEFLAHLFEPFEREQTSTVSGIQGTGLGLAITKSIVDMMHGTIAVTSEVGKGSEFTVSFRFRVKDAPCEAPEEVKTEEEAAPSAQFLAGKKILLVEDNELNQEIAKTVLEGVGLIIDTACDGTEAVAAMKAAQAGTYDLILMDIQMPVMDGYEAARTIRTMEDPAIANIPIVAMTANAFEEDRQRAVDAGMNDHVPKPIDIPRLIETLGRILKE